MTHAARLRELLAGDDPIGAPVTLTEHLVAIVHRRVFNAYLVLEDDGLTLAEFGIDDHPPLTATEKTATVGDLLSARSGVYLETPGETAATGRPRRGAHPPGTRWLYGNWDFNVLGNLYEPSNSTEASSRTTAGRVAVIEHLAPRGSGSPLHVQHTEDEWFYVTEGELRAFCSPSS